MSSRSVSGSTSGRRTASSSVGAPDIRCSRSTANPAAALPRSTRRWSRSRRSAASVRKGLRSATGAATSRASSTRRGRFRRRRSGGRRARRPERPRPGYEGRARCCRAGPIRPRSIRRAASVRGQRRPLRGGCVRRPRRREGRRPAPAVHPGQQRRLCQDLLFREPAGRSPCGQLPGCPTKPGEGPLVVTHRNRRHVRQLREGPPGVTPMVCYSAGRSRSSRGPAADAAIGLWPLPPDAHSPEASESARLTLHLPGWFSVSVDDGSTPLATSARTGAARGVRCWSAAMPVSPTVTPPGRRTPSPAPSPAPLPQRPGGIHCRCCRAMGRAQSGRQVSRARARGRGSLEAGNVPDHKGRISTVDRPTMS